MRAGSGTRVVRCRVGVVSCRVVALCPLLGFSTAAFLRSRESAVMESYPVASSVVRTADFGHPPLLAPIELPAAALWGMEIRFCRPD